MVHVSVKCCAAFPEEESICVVLKLATTEQEIPELEAHHFSAFSCATERFHPASPLPSPFLGPWTFELGRWGSAQGDSPIHQHAHTAGRPCSQATKASLLNHEPWGSTTAQVTALRTQNNSILVYGGVFKKSASRNPHLTFMWATGEAIRPRGVHIKHFDLVIFRVFHRKYQFHTEVEITSQPQT